MQFETKVEMNQYVKSSKLTRIGQIRSYINGYSCFRYMNNVGITYDLYVKKVA